MADGKSINLMPEDLRSKEKEAKAKKEDIFQVDLVVPAGQKPPKGAKQGPSFWSKLGSAFKRKPRFGEPTHNVKVDKKEEHKKDKPKKEKKKKEKKEEISLHLPKPEKKKPGKISYNEVKTDFSLPDEKDKEKKDKPKGKSWWSKLFARKPKEPKLKGPKITRAEEKPIMPRELPDKPEEKKSENKPEINLIKDIEEPTPPVAAPTIEDVRPVEAVQDMEIDTNVDEPEMSPKPDFSLPQEPVQAPAPAPEPEVEQKETKKSKKTAKTPKFHKPEPRIRAKFLDDGGGVDLIPTAAKTRSWRQIINLLVVALVGSAVIIGVFYGVLYYQSQRAEEDKRRTAQQISDIEKQILDYEELNREIDELGMEIELVSDLLTEHLYWTDFFRLLEKHTVAEVYYHGFSSGNSGSLTLDAVAPDFNSVARQLKVLQKEEAKEFVKEVTIMSASASDTGVEFDMILVLDDDLFYHDSLFVVEEDINGEEEQEEEEDDNENSET